MLILLLILRWNTFSVILICTFSFSHGEGQATGDDEFNDGARLELGQSERQSCEQVVRGERCRFSREELRERRERLERDERLLVRGGRRQRERHGRRERYGNSFCERKVESFK